MFAVERHRFIKQKLRERGRVSVVALAAELQLSPETIRRDMATLETEGVLNRVHGGAVDPARTAGPEPTMAQRSLLRVDEKKQIAQAALDYLPSRGCVYLEGASTSLVLAQLLQPGHDLTFVTNGVPIASVLGEQAHASVMMVGGRVRRSSMATVDDWALLALEGLHVDVAFLGTIAFSLEAGLTTPDLADAAVKRRSLAIADRTVLLAESAKFGAISTCRYGELRDIDVLITDDGLEPRTANEIRAAGPEVVLAPRLPSAPAKHKRSYERIEA